MADPLIDDVVVLCHFDGTNGSTTFIDSSPVGSTLTAVGTASLSTAASKWGSASIRFDGSGARATVPSTANFGFATKLWTVEAWIRLDSGAGSSDRQVVDFYVSTSQRLMCAVGVNAMSFYDGTTYRTGSPTLAAATWHHVAWCFDGTNIRAFLNGVVVWTYTLSKNFGTSMSLSIGATTTGTNPFLGYIDDLRVTIDQARYTAGFTPPAGPFDDPAVPGADAYLSSLGPLGAIMSVAAIGIDTRLSAQTPLGVFVGIVNSYSALLSNLGPLGAFQALASHDFTSQLDEAAPNLYVMDLVTPSGLVRVPISSWQATLQTDVQSYVQCVVPAVTDWVPDIEAATEFVISRIGMLLNGDAVEYEMARAPAQTVSLNGGSYNYTATISGYTAALEAVEDPPASLDRTLTGVRTVSRNSGNTRVRCDIDWLLRPGQRAYLDAEPIIVSFVNYYVPGFDQYMDVGDRA